MHELRAEDFPRGQREPLLASPLFGLTENPLRIPLSGIDDLLRLQARRSKDALRRMLFLIYLGWDHGARPAWRELGPGPILSRLGRVLGLDDFSTSHVPSDWQS
jgi:hypothetical protein